MDLETRLKAISNPTRIRILDWLRQPAANFPPHESGLSFDNGVCVAYIQDKAGASQSATSQHMSILHRAGFVIPTRIGKWTYYRRDEAAIARFMRDLQTILTPTGEHHD